jgi:hypothetical protein
VALHLATNIHLPIGPALDAAGIAKQFFAPVGGVVIKGRYGGDKD